MRPDWKTSPSWERGTTGSFHALGHPGIAVLHEKRQVCPQADAGLHMYVNSEDGNDGHSGRSPSHAWRSLQKALALLSNTTLNVPCTIHLNGEAPQAELENLKGVGPLILKLDAGSRMKGLQLRHIDGPVSIDAGTATLRTLDCRGVADLRLNGGVCEVGETPGLYVRSGFADVEGTVFRQLDTDRSAAAVAAEAGATVSIRDATAETCRKSLQVHRGATVILGRGDPARWPHRRVDGGLVQTAGEH